jgi:hypothetical protein
MLTPVNVHEILKAVKQLQSKKSEEMNGILMFALKKFIIPLQVRLQHIISKSLEFGIVPEQFKIAKVVPIFKGEVIDPCLIITAPSHFFQIFLKSWKKLSACDCPTI